MLRTKMAIPPLHLAIMHKNVALAKALLKHNADVNIKNNEGKTALHYTTDANHQEFIKLLLAHNAKAYSKVFK